MKLIFKILEYRKTHTLEETGKKFNLTGERVRQLELQKYRHRCKKHDRFYYNRCSFCLSEKYKLFMERRDFNFFLNEVEKEAKNRKRDWLSVERKRYIVRRLRDKHEKSFAEISRLLKRDYSSVINLYAKSNSK